MKGFFDRMPLPELLASGELHVAHLDLVGRARTKDLGVGRRVACLSNFGINLLQQRFVWHLTRCAVETFKFHEACSHALAEADLLEDWNDILCEAGLAEPDALTRFDSFIRDRREGGRTRQDDLRDPQRSEREECLSHLGPAHRERSAVFGLNWTPAGAMPERLLVGTKSAAVPSAGTLRHRQNR